MSGEKNVKITNAECRNSSCGERIFIIQAPLELHMVYKSGEGQNEISIWSFLKRLELLVSGVCLDTFLLNVQWRSQKYLSTEATDDARSKKKNYSWIFINDVI